MGLNTLRIIAVIAFIATLGSQLVLTTNGMPAKLDHITSSEEQPNHQTNTNNSAYNPQWHSQNAGRPNYATTTTITTSTTPATPLAELNPFNSATVPSWLSVFDYPDVGPGVPFIYNPDDVEQTVADNLLPPSNLNDPATQTSKPEFIASHTTPISFSSFQSRPNQQQQQHRQPATSITSTSISSTSTSTFPSKVTLPLPSIQKYNQNENTVTKPPIVFIPPPSADTDANADATDNYNNNRAIINDDHRYNANVNAFGLNSKKTTSFNKNFAAPFEPTGPSGTGSTVASFGVHQQTFPPFANQPSNTPTKTTFTKSDDGKVITNNNIFLQGSSGAKPFGFGNNAGPQEKDYQAAQTNQYFSTPGDFGGTATSSNAIHSSNGFSSSGSSFNTKSSTANSFAATPSVQTSSSSSSAFGGNGFSKGVTTTIASGNKFTGSFGGAPGVLGSGRIGYAVQPDGSIRDPDQAYRQPTGTGVGAAVLPGQQQQPSREHASAQHNGSYNNRRPIDATASASNVNAHKYRGRFGGPPGVLSPYDNA